ncbi:recombination protein F [Vibrio sp. qd031]|uniref:DNA replication/repair protein RecF n=1 Tax=Vibrio sp. qd031 TaxID=1603038 RepID=UPI000A10A0AC|nr:DNA replication/repair protein RecF [Vibrio sp. qd031]ORT51396.1 recombination protein F [Vibrio sp. qd031]
MPLTRLSLTQFRNIAGCSLDLSPGFNFVVGANGSGKTSLLEAIYLLSHGRSFRSNLTGRIIQNEHQELFVHGRFLTADQFELPIGINKKRDGSSEVKISGQSGQKLAQLAQVMPVQMIHPDGYELLTDGPKFRRSFIDWGVFYSEAEFFDAWGRVKRLHRQRNALLKNASSYAQLVYWDKELAPLAEKISQWRNDYVEQLLPYLKELCAQFLPEFEIDFNYYRGWDRQTAYHEILEKNFERDQGLGYTFSGPNKADLKVKIAGTPVEDVLSRGQLKLLVCALRLAQGQHLSESTNKECIYLVDDFASELDATRRQRLAECLIKTKAQVFVSSITEAQIASMSTENSKMFHVEHGKIEQG